MKKAISPIVAVSLLLVVAVVSVVGFQSFLNSYQTTIQSDVENEEVGQIIISSISNTDLFVLNTGETSISYSNIAFGGIDCNIQGNLSSGMNTINIKNCAQDKGIGINELVIYTSKKVHSKKFYSKANTPYSLSIKSIQKISDLEGNFNATLDNSDDFGYPLANLGDLDGDGINELGVGVLGDDDAGADAGALYILFLNESGSVRDYRKITEGSGNFTQDLQAADYFSFSGLSNIGDLNNDGVEDIAVGSLGDSGGALRGAIYILFMNDNYTAKSFQKINSTIGNFSYTLENNDEFGASITSLGDLDGDGNSEIVVAARRDDDGGNDVGALYVLYLNSDGTVKANHKINITTANLTSYLGPDDLFGLTSSNLGDLDGNGVDDLAVGAFGDDDGGTNRGALYILFMNQSAQVISSQKISDIEGNFNANLTDGDEFGTFVSAINDLNSDGIKDILVGSWKDGPDNKGAVYVINLNTNGTVKDYVKINENSSNQLTLDTLDVFGVAVTEIGDLDNNGVTDIAVGAFYDDDGGPERGALYILFME